MAHLVDCVNAPKTGAPRVAIIGGGWAGMAAATVLATHDIAPTVFEAAQTLGGRARRVVSHEANLDNGLHILIGAYTETIRMIRLVNESGQSQGLLQLPLQLRVEPGFRLRTWPLPSPLNFAAALLFARGLGFSAKLAALRFMRSMQTKQFRCNSGTTLSELLQQYRQPDLLVEYLWQPLCISALNTGIDEADAQVFLNVLRDSLAGPAGASDLLLPQTDFSALFPEPAAALVQRRGGEIRLGDPVTALHARDQGFEIAASATEFFSHVIVAVGPHRLEKVAGTISQLASQVEMVRQFHYQPIYSVFLQYPRETSLPAAMIGMHKGVVQWVFDRGRLCNQPGMMGAVISASGPHQALPRAELARRAHEQLARAYSFPEPQWSQVIAEKRATFACVPGLKRPANATAIDGLFLAGDYTDSPYPATLEAAVRSGSQCAHHILDQLGR